MTTTQVTVFNAERMARIENESIVSARLEDDDLILTTREGIDINVGPVRGPEGDVGPGGSMTGPASSENEGLPLFDGATGTVLKQGRLSQYQMERSLRNAYAGWIRNAGDAIDPTVTNGVLVNSMNSLKVVRSGLTSVNVWGGVGILSKGLLNVTTDNDHLFGAIEPPISGSHAGQFPIVASTPPVTYRRDIVAAEFSQAGVIALRYLTGVGNNTSFGSAALPAVAANQRALAILHITSGQLANATDVLDQRVIVPSSVIYGSSLPNTIPLLRRGQLTYDFNTKGLKVVTDNSGKLETPWNVPWGVLARAQIIAPQAGVTSTGVDITGLTVDVPLVQGRLYRIAFTGMTYGSAAGTFTAIAFQVGTPVIGERIMTHQSVSVQKNHEFALLHAPAASGTFTVKASVRSGGTGTSGVYAANTNPSMIYVEDIGPA